MARPRESRTSVKATINESFDLGKNTAKNSGIEIEIFDKSGKKGRGPKLGTLYIGQGSMRWWARNRKSTSKPSVTREWKDFLKLMKECEDGEA